MATTAVLQMRIEHSSLRRLRVLKIEAKLYPADRRSVLAARHPKSTLTHPSNDLFLNEETRIMYTFLENKKSELKC